MILKGKSIEKVVPQSCCHKKKKTNELGFLYSHTHYSFAKGSHELTCTPKYFQLSNMKVKPPVAQGQASKKEC